MALPDYKLSAVLYGHSLDVRCVAKTKDCCILSASRDRTAKLWHPEGVKDFVNAVTYKGHKNFVSCICWLPPCEAYPDGIVVTGSNDNTILGYNLQDGNVVMTLEGHENAVCSVTPGLDSGILLSSSWDSTAKVWNVNTPHVTPNTLKGHQAAVWAVVELGNGTYATASADKTIKLWKKNGSLISTLTGHTDCVRGLAVASHDSFLSCSNDASIRLWANKGDCLNTYYGHSNYIYSISLNPGAGAGAWASSGEDGAVRLWSAGDCVREIRLPVHSVWSVVCMDNGDIVTGSSDGIVRVFTKDPARYADEVMLKQFEEEVEKLQAASQQEIGGFKLSELPGPEVLLEPGRTDGQTKLVRRGAGVKCYSWDAAAGVWAELGDVLGANPPAEGKTMHQGKEYDFVFSVDIKDGAPPLKLPFNKGEDPWVAAQAFIHSHDLPQVYLDQVANFIITNAKLDALPASSNGRHFNSDPTSRSVLPVLPMDNIDAEKTPGDTVATDPKQLPTINNQVQEPTFVITTENECLKNVTGSSINGDERKKLQAFLDSNPKVFKPSSKSAKYVEHYINTGDSDPISAVPYPLTLKQQDVLQKQLNHMIKDGIIVPCSSTWLSPVLILFEKDKLKVFIDYGKLNAITIPDTYPIPTVNDLLRNVKPTPYMTVLHLREEFSHINVHKDHQDKTAFTTPLGNFKFIRLPFGLRNSAATRQRLIDRISKNVNVNQIAASLDNIVIVSLTFQEHLSDLEKVFNTLKETNLGVNYDSSRFCCSSINFLWRYVGYVEAISLLPTPSNLEHLIIFLQTCFCYGRFISNLSEIAGPLTRLTQNEAEWIWTEEQEQAFKMLKDCLITPPVFQQADNTKPYFIKIDASRYAIGAVLIQGEGDDEHPVGYVTKTLGTTERNYTATEKQAYALLIAVGQFRRYIGFTPFTVITKHLPLQWLMSFKSPSGALGRYALQLQPFDITIKYSPGENNVVANTLSHPICNKETFKNCGVCNPSKSSRNPEKIRLQQLKDEQLTIIVKGLEDCENTEFGVYWSNKGYFMSDGTLYRYNPTGLTSECLLVVPQHQWADTVEAYHFSDPSQRHYGANEYYRHITKRYYWSGMRAYIESYLKNCTACQRIEVLREEETNSKPNSTHLADTPQTRLLVERFETIAFDLLGPIPVTRNGKKWILIVQDVATEWVELFALEDDSPNNCANVLRNEIFLRYGIPKRIISENEQFGSFIMQHMTFCLAIDQEMPSLVGRANPVAPRFRELKIQLKTLVEDDIETWEEKLPAIRLAMNTSRSLLTGRTPGYLAFGRELKIPPSDLRQIVGSERIHPEGAPRLLFLDTTLKRTREVIEGKNIIRKFADPLTGESRYVPAPGARAADPFTGAGAYTTLSAVSSNSDRPLIPHDAYIRFDQANLKAICDKLKEFNSKVGDGLSALTDEQLADIVKLGEMNSTYNPETISLLKQILEWPKEILFPVLDITRLAIRNKEINAELFDTTYGPSFIKYLLSLLAPDNLPANQMLAMRVLANAFSDLPGEMLVLAAREPLVRALAGLARLSSNAQIAAASVLLNLSVALAQHGDAPALAACLLQQLARLHDPEAYFRALIALGTLLAEAPNRLVIQAKIVANEPLHSRLKRDATAAEKSKLQACSFQILSLL